MIVRNLLAAALLIGTAPPALAAAISAPAPSATPPAMIPAQLDAAQRTEYRAIFTAIRSGDWATATSKLDAMPDGLLTPFARAELYTAARSPRVEADPLIALITRAPYLPQAGQIARLASTRGATVLPGLPTENNMARLAGAPRRLSARSLRSDAIAVALGQRILPLIRDDRPADAEALLVAQETQLSPEARTEWRQRVAWSFFLTGDDSAARRVAGPARTGMGEWAVQADWVAGLAAWRMRDCQAAADAFSNVATRARDTEMMAAGLFWAARADIACGRPERVQARLRTASRMNETFYGLLAGGALGLTTPVEAATAVFGASEWTSLSQRPNVLAAAALIEIGENGLADSLLRHQARIGDIRDHEALLHLAARLNLPSTQIWLAQNGPTGAQMSMRSRYPAPSWVPQGGWRVDKSLIFAHALQESQFRADAVSPAGARGLMQIMPGTAQLISRKAGIPLSGALNDPQTNITYAQYYLEELRDFSGTGGLLPKVIAAYNAGPGSVARWNDRRRDNGDPLLFIESIPFYETRAYVAVVLRNYWMYQHQAGQRSNSLKAMAQGMWPRFPGMPGRAAIRLDPMSGVASAD